MTLDVASVVCGGQGPQFTYPVTSNNDPMWRMIDNRDNRMTPCEAYQLALDTTMAHVICIVHDDVAIHDAGWRQRLLRLFENPLCIAAGPGGAIGLGNRDLYRKPYRLQNLARIGYASNQDGWETHGGHFTGERRVAVLEQFMMAVRVDWLRARGGWPVKNIRHHGIDMWLACEAARDDKEIWQAGFCCAHFGGASSTKPIYSTAQWLAGGSLALDHEEPHAFLFNEYRDVLPIEVGQ